MVAPLQVVFSACFVIATISAEILDPQNDCLDFEETKVYCILGNYSKGELGTKNLPLVVSIAVTVYVCIIFHTNFLMLIEVFI